MRFIDILQAVDSLFGCTISGKILASPDREIQSVRFIPSQGGLSFRPDTVYVSGEELPDLPAPDDSVNLICCGSALAVRAMGAKGLNYIHVANPDAAALIYNRLRLSLTGRSPDEAEKMQRLTDALLSGKGLQHMADISAEVFGNPMRISDTSYNYLVTIDMESSPDPFLQELIDGRTSDSNVDYGAQQHLRERMRDLRYTIRNPIPEQEVNEHVLGTAVITCPCLLHGVVVGFCTLYDAWRPYSLEDYELLHYFSLLVATEMQKNSYYSANKGMMYSYFLHDLLTNSLSNIKNVRDRLRLMGWTPKRNLFVLAVELGNMGALSINPSVIAERLHAVAGDSIYVIFDEAIVLLLSRDSAARPDAGVLKRFLLEMNLRAGLSARFTDIMETSRHYESALQAARLGALMEPGKGLYSFPDQAVYQLFEGRDCPLLLSAMADGAVPKILDYDRGHTPPLLPTLRAWLESGFSSAGAAASLGIHKNTLLYRLEKLRAVTGLAMEPGNDFFALTMALKLYDYMSAK